MDEQQYDIVLLPRTCQENYATKNGSVNLVNLITSKKRVSGQEQEIKNKLLIKDHGKIKEMIFKNELGLVERI